MVSKKPNADGFWDADIAALDMSDVEKNGLQMYRNYQLKFNIAREETFAESVDATPPDTTELAQVMSLMLNEDIRFVPVIACAFADEELKRMFSTFLRDGIPGGKKAMLGRFGPISTLFARIQFAYAFDMVSPDILTPLDRLRDHRNKLSHTWNSVLLADFFKDPLPQMEGLEEALASRPAAKVLVEPNLFPEAALRIRTMWILTRIFYESRYYPLAKASGVTPARALYGPRHPKALGAISNFALTFSQMVKPK